LKELNPFVISDIDYSAFNENGGLNLYDPASNPGGMASEHIEMRAQMLYWRLQYDQKGQDLNEYVVASTNWFPLTLKWPFDCILRPIAPHWFLRLCPGR
jgi:hypothetical protein